MSSAAVIAGMTATVVATIALAGFSSRVARTTGDFYVAARSVPAWWNASRDLRGVPVGAPPSSGWRG